MMLFAYCLFVPLSPVESPPPAAGGDAVAISFDEAIGLAARSPAVAGTADAVAVKTATDGRVGPFTANPMLHVQPGFAPGAAHAPLEGEAGLYQAFNLGGLAEARRSAMRYEEDALRAEARAAALSGRLEAAQAWIDLWAAEKALALAREELTLARELTARTHKAAAAAALTRAEAAEADAYEAEARLAVLSVEGEVTDLGYALAAAVSSPAGRPLVTAGDVPAAPVPPRSDWASLIARAAALPEARAVALTAEAERAQAREVMAAAGTVIELGVLGQRDAAGRTVLLGSLGFSLPLFDHGHRAAGVLEAQAARRAGAADDASRRAAVTLARVLHEIEHTGEVLREIHEALLVATAESARLRDAAFRAGDATVVEVLLARRAAASARAREVRASAAHAWARAKAALVLAQLDAGARVSP
jgi:cobalt-zinc-cadmium efflux system outer membrane protein